MSYYHRHDSEFGTVIVILSVFVLFGLLFAGLFHADTLADKRAEQCISAGKDWVDGNCLGRK